MLNAFAKNCLSAGFFFKVTTQAPFFPAGIQIGEFSDECKCNYKKWWVSWTQFRHYTFSKGREEKKEKREAYITYGLNFFWISKPWQLIVSKHVLDKYLTQQCKVLQLGEKLSSCLCIWFNWIYNIHSARSTERKRKPFMRGDTFDVNKEAKCGLTGIQPTITWAWIK